VQAGPGPRIFSSAEIDYANEDVGGGAPLNDVSAQSGEAVGDALGQAIEARMMGAYDAVNYWREKFWSYMMRDRREYEVLRDRIEKRAAFQFRDKFKEEWDAQEKWNQGKWNPQAGLAERINNYWKEFDSRWRWVR